MSRNNAAGIVWMTILCVSLLSSWSPAQSLPAAPPKLDVSYVTPDVVFAAVAHPRRVLTAPEMDVLPIEVIAAFGIKKWGIDPAGVDEVLFIAEVHSETAESSGAFVIRLAKPCSLAQLRPAFKGRTPESQLDGKPCYRDTDGKALSVFMPNDRTVLSAPYEMLERMIAQQAKPVEGPMTRLLGDMDASDDLFAVFVMDRIRSVTREAMAAIPWPPEFEPVRRLPDLVTTVDVNVNFLGGARALVSVRAKDEVAAAELETMANRALQMLEENVLSKSAEGSAIVDPAEHALAAYVDRMTRRMIRKFQPVRKGDRLVVSVRADDPDIRFLVSIPFWIQTKTTVQRVLDTTNKSTMRRSVEQPVAHREVEPQDGR
ncbi:MAG: hypothetical protein JW809_07865 [Pirellulales bacterium]|nr:hypothetical protein [Pirellulales bacterium]